MSRGVRSRGQAGLSIMELLAVTLIAAFVFGFAIHFVNRPTRLVQSLNDRLLENRSTDLSLALLNKALSRSFIASTKLVSCEGRTLAFGVTGARPVQLSKSASSPEAVVPVVAPGDPPPTVDPIDPDKRLSFVFSEDSTFASSDLINQDRLRMADVSAVLPGDLILLTHLQHPEAGSIYRLKSVDPATRLVEIENPPAPPPGIPCAYSQTQVSLQVLLSDPRYLQFGRAASTFRVDVLRFISIGVENNARAGVSDLITYLWPAKFEPLTRPDPTRQVLMSKFEDLTLKSDWVPDVTGGGSQSFQMTISRLDDAPAGGRVRESRLFGTYRSSTSGRSNFSAPTTPATATLNFKTCGITVTPAPGIYLAPEDAAPYTSPDYDHYRDLVLVQGMASNNVTFPTLDVLASPALATSPTPRCWNLADPGQVSKVAGSVTFLRGGGATSFALYPRDTTSKPFVCDISRGGFFTVTMLDFDNNFGRNVVFNCTGSITYADLPIPNFVYSGAQAAKCLRSGVITLATLGPDPANPNSGHIPPALFLAPDSCDWDGHNRAACDPNLYPGEKLVKVRVKPFLTNAATRVPFTVAPIANPTNKNPIGDSDGAITCTDI